jgi:hypothetical protein
MALSVRSQKLLVEDGDRRLCARVARNGAFFGTLSAPRDITQRAAVFAHLIVPLEWEMRANSARRKATPDRTHTLWSAPMARSRKDSCAMILAAQDKKVLTMFAGVLALQAPNSVVFCA